MGIHDHERGVKQPVRFDIEVLVQTPQGDDLIDNVLDYEYLEQSVDNALSESRAELQRHWQEGYCLYYASRSSTCSDSISDKLDPMSSIAVWDVRWSGCPISGYCQECWCRGWDLNHEGLATGASRPLWPSGTPASLATRVTDLNQPARAQNMRSTCPDCENTLTGD